MHVYLEVDDLDRFWRTYRKLLPDADTQPPAYRAHGMREFHIVIAHTQVQLSLGQRSS